MGSLFSYSLLEKQGNRFLFYEILKFFSSLCLVRKVCISSTCIIGSGSPSGQKTLFTLAAATSSNSSRTSKWVWDNGVIISLGVLRKSRSSHIWRLCRVLEGLSLDYG